MKFVVDTNVLIAAFLTAGTSHEVVESILSRKEGIVSDYILEEFRRVLLSSKFDFPPALVEVFVSHLKRFACLEQVTEKYTVPCTDPADEEILRLCLTVQADYLITGDKVLIAMKKVGSTQIITPSEFWKVLGPHNP